VRRGEQGVEDGGGSRGPTSRHTRGPSASQLPYIRAPLSSVGFQSAGRLAADRSSLLNSRSDDGEGGGGCSSLRPEEDSLSRPRTPLSAASALLASADRRALSPGTPVSDACGHSPLDRLVTQSHSIIILPRQQSQLSCRSVPCSGKRAKTRSRDHSRFPLVGGLKSCLTLVNGLRRFFGMQLFNEFIELDCLNCNGKFMSFYDI
jgi:hypothetical protein